MNVKPPVYFFILFLFLLNNRSQAQGYLRISLDGGASIGIIPKKVSNKPKNEAEYKILYMIISTKKQIPL